MCYNVELIVKRFDKYAKRYNEILPKKWDKKSLPAEMQVFYFVSGFSHPKLPIVKNDGIFLYQWGLIPFWIKDKTAAASIRSKTLNAAGETVFEKPSFRRAIAKQRCLLGINGFYEWREFNKVKYPYLIKLKNSEIFSLGCIYETWQDKETNEQVNTFSIVTTSANPLMEKIHNVKKRMPLIIDKEDEEKWIDTELPKEIVKDLIKPYDEKKMTAYTVSKRVSNPKFNRNVPESIEEVQYPELD